MWLPGQIRVRKCSPGTAGAHFVQVLKVFSGQFFFFHLWFSGHGQRSCALRYSAETSHFSIHWASSWLTRWLTAGPFSVNLIRPSRQEALSDLMMLCLWAGGKAPRPLAPVGLCTLSAWPQAFLPPQTVNRWLEAAKRMGQGRTDTLVEETRAPPNISELFGKMNEN